MHDELAPSDPLPRKQSAILSQHQTIPEDIVHVVLYLIFWFGSAAFDSKASDNNSIQCHGPGPLLEDSRNGSVTFSGGRTLHSAFRRMASWTDPVAFWMKDSFSVSGNQTNKYLWKTLSTWLMLPLTQATLSQMIATFKISSSFFRLVGCLHTPMHDCCSIPMHMSKSAMCAHLHLSDKA